MEIVKPGSPSYNCARRIVNKRFDVSPAAIIFCDDVDDVQEALKMSLNDKKNIRVRSARHSYEGFSIGGSDSYVIDISALNQVVVNSKTQTAIIGTGAQLYYEIYLELWNQGKVTIPGGSCPTVGIGGLASGGGFSFSGRQFGLTCDSIVSLEIVTSDGKILKADNKNNQDLFWACCGGGNGNFGIITQYEFKIYPATDVAIFAMSWDFDDKLPDIADAWASLVENTPKELMPFLRFTSSENGATLSSFGQYYGDQKDLENIVDKYFGGFKHKEYTIETLSNIDAVKHWGNIHTDNREPNKPHFMLHSHPEQYPQTKQGFVFDDGGYFKASSIMLKRFFNRTELDYIKKIFETKESNGSFIVLDAQNGASSKLPHDYNAYAHRNALSSVQIYTSWKNPDEETSRIKLIEELRENLKAAGQGAYVNYPDKLIDDWSQAYYGDHYARLQKIKAKYDPNNVFRHSQSIVPA